MRSRKKKGGVNRSNRRRDNRLDDRYDFSVKNWARGGVYV